MPGPRGQWKTEKSTENWFWSHLWCTNDPRGQRIGEVLWKYSYICKLSLNVNIPQEIPQPARKVTLANWAAGKSRIFFNIDGIHCLPTCGISPPFLISKPSSKLSFFNRHFYKSMRAMICVRVYMGGGGKLCLCLCVYLREWCVLAHWVFLTGRFALYKSHPLLLSIIIIIKKD